MSDHVLIAAIQQKDQQIKKMEEEILLYEVVAEIERMEAKEAQKPKRVRSNDRTEVIALARKRANNPDDPRSVLDALRRMVPFPPLCGYDSAERVLKWDTGNEDQPPKFQKEKDALAAIRRYIDKNRIKL